MTIILGVELEMPVYAQGGVSIGLKFDIRDLLIYRMPPIFNVLYILLLST